MARRVFDNSNEHIPKRNKISRAKARKLRAKARRPKSPLFRGHQ